MHDPFLFLAPLQGYTEYYFRRAYFRHFEGLDACISPFISLVQGKEVKLSCLRDVLPENNGCIPLIPQLNGSDPELFVLMLRRLSELGYDSVNWNLSCPYRSVIRKAKGAGLIGRPEQVRAVLDQAFKLSDIRLSLKLRLGFHKEEEIFELLEQIKDYPLEFIIIHPRLAKDPYNGELLLDAFQRITSATSFDMVYNGDIQTVDFYKSLSNMMPSVSSWMLGRGVLQDLFLPSKIKNSKPSDADSHARLFAFHHELIREMSTYFMKEKSFKNKIKEYWFWFHKAYAEGGQYFERIKKSEDLQEIIQLVTRITKGPLGSSHGKSLDL